MSQTDAVDLSYADPEPPMDLLERSRQRGRRLRRRRKTSSSVGAAVLIVSMVLAGQWVRSHVDPGVSTISAAGGKVISESELATLPVSRGRGPAAADFTAEGYAVNQLIGQELSADPIGSPTVITADPGQAAEQLLWVTKDARFILGNRDSADAPLQESLGRTLNDLPDEGFWGGTTYSDSTASPGKAEPARTIITGLVRGPVTKVVISLPGGDVTAHLETAPVPGLGTFYWVVTDEFDGDGKTLSTMDSAAAHQDTGSVTRTVYRGTDAVFHCADTACLGSF